MKKVYLASSLALVVALSITSCKKKDEVAELPVVVSKTEATTTINTSADKMYDDIVALTQSQGASSFESMNKIMTGDDSNNPFIRMEEASIPDQMKSKIIQFRDFFLPNKKTIGFGRIGAEENRFNFSSNLGTYNWNSTDKKWDTVNGSNTSSIILNFPSDTLSNVNDAKLTVSAYTDMAVVKDGNTEYMPTLITAALTVNAIKQAGINLTATYSNSGNPTSLNANIYLKPFTLISNYSISGSVVTVNSYIDKDGENSHVMSEGISVTFGDIENLKNPQTVNNAYVQFRDLKVAGTANLKDFESDSLLTMNEQFNRNITAGLFNNTTGNKLGTFSMIETTDSLTTNKSNELYIVFNDQSTEKAETFFQKHIDKMKSFFNK
jgi:hypothetical protein